MQKNWNFCTPFFSAPASLFFCIAHSKIWETAILVREQLRRRESRRKKFILQANNRESDDTNGYNPLQKIAVYESDESDEIDVGMVKMQLK